MAGTRQYYPGAAADHPREQADGMVGILDVRLAALAGEFDLPVKGDRSGRYRCSRDSVSIRR
jgi:hypothetical protein